MSQTISQQFDAAVATLQADNAALATALGAIQTQLAGMPVGSTVTQAQIDGFNTALADLATQVTAAQAEAGNPAAPVTPSTP